MNFAKEILETVYTRRLLSLATTTREKLGKLGLPFSRLPNLQVIVLGEDIVPIRAPERGSPLRLRRGRVHVRAESVVARKLEDPRTVIFVLEPKGRFLLEAFVWHVEGMLEDLAARNLWSDLTRWSLVGDAAFKICHPWSNTGFIDCSTVRNQHFPGAASIWSVSHEDLSC